MYVFKFTASLIETWTFIGCYQVESIAYNDFFPSLTSSLWISKQYVGVFVGRALIGPKWRSNVRYKYLRRRLMFTIERFTIEWLTYKLGLPICDYACGMMKCYELNIHRWLYILIHQLLWGMDEWLFPLFECKQCYWLFHRDLLSKSNCFSTLCTNFLSFSSLFKFTDWVGFIYFGHIFRLTFSPGDQWVHTV